MGLNKTRHYRKVMHMTKAEAEPQIGPDGPARLIVPPPLTPAPRPALTFLSGGWRNPLHDMIQRPWDANGMPVDSDD